MARDATARLYDVDRDSVVLTQLEGKKKYAPGKITFAAKKGKLVDLDKLHESIWATRLSGGTSMKLEWLEATVVGEVAVVKKQVILKVVGSKEFFVLAERPDAKPEGGDAPAFRRLLEALERERHVVSVTGRVDGWSGRFPTFLSKLPERPRRLLVTGFKTSRR